MQRSSGRSFLFQFVFPMAFRSAASVTLVYKEETMRAKLDAAFLDIPLRR